MNMDYSKLSCDEFVERLSSKAPVPGGGGASALVGAVGMALGNMVGALTVGKKKYAHVEGEVSDLMDRAAILQNELLSLIQEDADVFEPLSRAYGMPTASEAEKSEKDRVMGEALRAACDVPLRIMQKCCAAIELHREFAEKGAAIAISDVGVGVVCCKSALLGASLNVFINTKAMSDRVLAAKNNKLATDMLDTYTPLADKIFNDVLSRLNPDSH